MGCAMSKQKDRLCRNCNGSCSPPIPRRSYSLHRHHPPQCDGDDDHHLVSLTSSSLEPLNIESFRKAENKIAPFDVYKKRVDAFSVGSIETKKWSQMIDERIPKIVPMTPIMTPPGEPEKINAWELMEGLEDISPLRPVNHPRSFSFQYGKNLIRDEFGKTGESVLKPMWLELADKESDSKRLEFDPEFISTFRDVHEEEGNSVVVMLNGENPEREESRRFFEDQGNFEENNANIFYFGKDLERDGNGGNFEEENSMDMVGNYGSLETEKNRENSETMTHIGINTEKLKSGEKVRKRVVFYFTSLRGVRKTYEDCCQVRVILKSIGVRIDERDVSMHLGFKDELKELLGDKFSTSPLPRVFFGEKYIGGAHEITHMHEEGQLERMLMEGGEGACERGVCETCGDVRFVPCESCFGSCKIYYGDTYECGYDDEEYEGEEFDESECGFQRCPDCNENGLVRCPICCD